MSKEMKMVYGLTVSENGEKSYVLMSAEKAEETIKAEFAESALLDVKKALLDVAEGLNDTLKRDTVEGEVDYLSFRGGVIGDIVEALATAERLVEMVKVEEPKAVFDNFLFNRALTVPSSKLTAKKKDGTIVSYELTARTVSLRFSQLNTAYFNYGKEHNFERKHLATKDNYLKFVELFQYFTALRKAGNGEHEKVEKLSDKLTAIYNELPAEHKWKIGLQTVPSWGAWKRMAVDLFQTIFPLSMPLYPIENSTRKNAILEAIETLEIDGDYHSKRNETVVETLISLYEKSLRNTAIAHRGHGDGTTFVTVKEGKVEGMEEKADTDSATTDTATEEVADETNA